MTLNELFIEISKALTEDSSLATELKKSAGIYISNGIVEFVSIWNTTEGVDYDVDCILPRYSLIWRLSNHNDVGWFIYSQNNLKEYNEQLENAKYEGVEIIMSVAKDGSVKIIRAPQVQCS